MTVPFSRERFAVERAQRRLTLGAPLTLRGVTGSTNDDALAAGRDGAPHGATFVAERQTQGRGRRGRSWFSEEGDSLLCSVLLRVPLALEAISALALASGLAVREAVAKAAPSDEAREAVLVKWPNDVWVGKKKIAGVLAESQVQGGVLVAAAVGFGINVTTSVFPDELDASATSLRRLGAVTEREVLLADALSALEVRVSLLLSGGVGALSPELSRKDALLGLRVRIDGREGIAEGIDGQGRLVLRLGDEERVEVSAGTVELVE